MENFRNRAIPITRTAPIIKSFFNIRFWAWLYSSAMVNHHVPKVFNGCLLQPDNSPNLIKSSQKQFDIRPLRSTYQKASKLYPFQIFSGSIFRLHLRDDKEIKIKMEADNRTLV